MWAQWLLVWVTSWTVVAFMACAVDKRRAQNHLHRVRERTLLSFALIGGSPGLVAGMLLFHHKVRKASFVLRLLLVVLVQALLLVAAWRAGLLGPL